MRRERTVSLDQFKDLKCPNELLAGQEEPNWLLTEGTPPKGSITFSSTIWQSALARRLPLVVLDP